MRTLLALSSLALYGVAIAQGVGNPTSNLSFHAVSGDNDNYFLRDTLSSAQLLLTSPNSTASARRLVVALPAGNSGALVYFLTANLEGNSTLNISLVEDSLKTTSADYSNFGVEANLVFDQNATLGVTIIGAVRAMRGGLPHVLARISS